MTEKKRYHIGHLSVWQIYCALLIYVNYRLNLIMLLVLTFDVFMTLLKII